MKFISSVVIAIGLLAIAWSISFGQRYAFVMSTNWNSVYRLDRMTGTVALCYPERGGCASLIQVKADIDNDPNANAINEDKRIILDTMHTLIKGFDTNLPARVSSNGSTKNKDPVDDLEEALKHYKRSQ